MLGKLKYFDVIVIIAGILLVSVYLIDYRDELLEPLVIFLILFLSGLFVLAAYKPFVRSYFLSLLHNKNKDEHGNQSKSALFFGLGFCALSVFWFTIKMISM